MFYKTLYKLWTKIIEKKNSPYVSRIITEKMENSTEWNKFEKAFSNLFTNEHRVF